MDFYQIAATILLPAAISIFVTVVNNKRQKDLEFEYDYRKYILEKRKKAYDQIEAFIHKLNEDSTQIRQHINTKERKPELINNLMIEAELIEVHNYIWISGKMAKSLRAVSNYFEKMEYLGPTDDAGIKDATNEMRLKVVSMIFQFYHDVTDLSKIERFKKERTNDMRTWLEVVSTPPNKNISNIN